MGELVALFGALEGGEEREVGALVVLDFFDEVGARGGVVGGVAPGAAGVGLNEGRCVGGGDRGGVGELSVEECVV